MTSLFAQKRTKYLIGFAVAIILFLLTLYWMGRIPYCKCGFGVWTSSAWSSETSQNIWDPYSFSHLLHGILFFWVLLLFRKKLSLLTRFSIAVGIEMFWEILENSPFIINRYRAVTAALDYTGDSIMNSASDLVCAILGFWVAYKLGWKWTLLIVVAVELLMLYFMRDNLTMNIIMLIHPIPALQQWQLGHL